jgi:hypothetical protein
VRLKWLASVAESPSGQWLFKKIDTGPILSGLWLPPFAEEDPTTSPEQQAAELLPFATSGPPETLNQFAHSITHRRIAVVPLRFRVDSQRCLPDGWLWANPRAPRLPTSSLLGKILLSAGNE